MRVSGGSQASEAASPPVNGVSICPSTQTRLSSASSRVIRPVQPSQVPSATVGEGQLAHDRMEADA